MNKIKEIPIFKTEAEERAFWESSNSDSSSEYVNWKRAQQVLMPNVKPSTKTISLRLHEELLGSGEVKPSKR